MGIWLGDRDGVVTVSIGTVGDPSPWPGVPSFTADDAAGWALSFARWATDNRDEFMRDVVSPALDARSPLMDLINAEEDQAETATETER